MSDPSSAASSTRQALPSQKAEYKQDRNQRREKKRKDKKRKRDDTLLLDLPSAKAAAVEGRSTVSNHLAAEALKGFLMGAQSGEEGNPAISEEDMIDAVPLVAAEGPEEIAQTTPAPNPSDKSLLSLSSTIFNLAIPQASPTTGSSFNLVMPVPPRSIRDPLTEAFRRTYSLVGNEERRRGYTSMYPEDMDLEEDQEKKETSNCLKAFNFLSTIKNEPISEERRKTDKPSDFPSCLLKDLLQETKLSGAHGTGIGVIGSHSFFTKINEGTTNILADSCDMAIPNIDYTLDWKIRKVEDTDTKYKVGEYVIDFGHKVLPISIEYPARVFNTLIHAMKEGDQPKMTWEYSSMATEGTEEKDSGSSNQKFYKSEGGEQHVTCHFSINKPTADPDTRICNRKTLIGLPYRSKVDASNSALETFIKEDGLAWLFDRNDSPESERK